MESLAIRRDSVQQALKTLAQSLSLIQDSKYDFFHSELRDSVIKRFEYSNELLDISKAVSSGLGQGAFFVVGDIKNAAVHSEPKMDTERLFFSVVAGDESEINELYIRSFGKSN